MNTIPSIFFLYLKLEMKKLHAFVHVGILPEKYRISSIFFCEEPEKLFLFGVVIFFFVSSSFYMFCRTLHPKQNLSECTTVIWSLLDLIPKMFSSLGTWMFVSMHSRYFFYSISISFFEIHVFLFWNYFSKLYRLSEKLWMTASIRRNMELLSIKKKKKNSSMTTMVRNIEFRRRGCYFITVVEKKREHFQKKICSIDLLMTPLFLFYCYCNCCLLIYFRLIVSSPTNYGFVWAGRSRVLVRICAAMCWCKSENIANLVLSQKCNLAHLIVPSKVRRIRRGVLISIARRDYLQLDCDTSSIFPSPSLHLLLFLVYLLGINLPLGLTCKGTTYPTWSSEYWSVWISCIPWVIEREIKREKLVYFCRSQFSHARWSRFFFLVDFTLLFVLSGWLVFYRSWIANSFII